MLGIWNIPPEIELEISIHSHDILRTERPLCTRPPYALHRDKTRVLFLPGARASFTHLYVCILYVRLYCNNNETISFRRVCVLCVCVYLLRLRRLYEKREAINRNRLCARACAVLERMASTYPNASVCPTLACVQGGNGLFRTFFRWFIPARICICSRLFHYSRRRYYIMCVCVYIFIHTLARACVCINISVVKK